MRVRVLMLILVLAAAVSAQTDIPGHLTVYPSTGDGAGACVKLLSLSGGGQFGICAKTTSSGVASVVLPESNSAGVLENDGSGNLSWGTAGAGAPFTDASPLIKNDADPTKLVQFDASGITTMTTRVLAVQDADYTLAGVGINNGFSADQDFLSGRINIGASGSSGPGIRDNSGTLECSNDGSSWVACVGSGGYWSRTGTNLTTATAGDTVTLDSHLLFSAPSTSDIGDATNYAQTLYIENIDAAPSGVTNNYTQVRKLEIADNNVGTKNFWDIQLIWGPSVSNNYLRIRDNAGNVVMQLEREFVSSTTNKGYVDLSWLPYADASWDLGSSSKYWSWSYINTGVFSQLIPKSAGNSDVGGTGDAFGDGYFTTIWNNQFRIDSGGGSDMSFEGNLLPWTNEGFSLGEQGQGWDTVFGRRWESWDGTYARIVLNSPGAGSNTGNAVNIENASGSPVFYVSYGGTTTTINLSTTGNHALYGYTEYEDADQSNYVRVSAPSVVSSNYSITLPSADCSGGYYLTLSSGVMQCGLPAGSGLPGVDTTAVVYGSSDPTKYLRFEVDGFTTGTTRVLTPPDADITIAGINLAQTWTATQTMRDVLFSSAATYNVGSTTAPAAIIYSQQGKYNDGTYDRVGFKCCTGNAFWYADASNTNKFYVTTAGSLYTANSVTTDGPLTFGSSSILYQGATTRLDGSGNAYVTSLTVNSGSTINSSRQWAAGDFVPSTGSTYTNGSNSLPWAYLVARTQIYIHDGTYVRASLSAGGAQFYNSAGSQVAGVSTTSGAFNSNGSVGYSGSIFVRNSAGTASCTLTFAGGLFISQTGC